MLSAPLFRSRSEWVLPLQSASPSPSPSSSSSALPLQVQSLSMPPWPPVHQPARPATAVVVAAGSWARRAPCRESSVCKGMSWGWSLSLSRKKFVWSLQPLEQTAGVAAVRLCPTGSGDAAERGPSQKGAEDVLSTETSPTMTASGSAAAAAVAGAIAGRGLDGKRGTPTRPTAGGRCCS